MAYYWLTPPSRAVLSISVLLAVLALFVRNAHIAIPVVSNHSFETLLIAFLLLLAGAGRVLRDEGISERFHEEDAKVTQLHARR